MSASAASTNYSRRNFLRGRRTENHPPRPPWALAEFQFVDQCERCDKCAQACEENIIVKGSGGFPEVKFDSGECTFCEACVDVCPSSALDKSHVERGFPHVVSIEESCFSQKGIVCQTCRDECEARAITLKWESAIPVPVIEEDLCTGCGACVSVCPNQSITIKKI